MLGPCERRTHLLLIRTRAAVASLRCLPVSSEWALEWAERAGVNLPGRRRRTSVDRLEYAISLQGWGAQMRGDFAVCHAGVEGQVDCIALRSGQLLQACGDGCALQTGGNGVEHVAAVHILVLMPQRRFRARWDCDVLRCAQRRQRSLGSMAFMMRLLISRSCRVWALVSVSKTSRRTSST